MLFPHLRFANFTLAVHTFGMTQPVDFIARWQNSGASERANYQLFLSELCGLIEVAPLQPAVPALIVPAGAKIPWPGQLARQAVVDALIAFDQIQAD